MMKLLCEIQKWVFKNYVFKTMKCLKNISKVFEKGSEMKKQGVHVVYTTRVG